MNTYVIKGKKKLRTGVTTGSCAAAAALAAARALILGERPETVSLVTPAGRTIHLPVLPVETSGDTACYAVEKDSGDDPDVTNGVKILARVSCAPFENAKMPPFSDEAYPGISIYGGEGIGTVTREGLEQPVGYPAINRVPRQMIYEALSAVRDAGTGKRDLFVEISIPEGVSLAEKTFNPELGIRGGLSVLGSTGILEPMSEKAIIDTIEAEIKIRAAEGRRVLLSSPGNYGRRYMEDYLGLSDWDSVKCSNYVGDMIDLAVGHGFTKILLVGNLGKLIKLAAGIMNTHSKTADGRREIMVTHAALAGADQTLLTRLYAAIGTEEMLDILEEAGIRKPVTESILSAIDEKLSKRAGEDVMIGAIVFSESYGYLGETPRAGELLEMIKEQ